jgi:hypothetical protein
VVEMFASSLFCSPSLDGEKPGVSPRYFVREGKHQVWCTMTSGEKVQLGPLEMFAPPDGAPFRVRIMRGPDNRPVIDRDNTTKTTGSRHPDPDPAGKPPASGSVPR